MARDEALSVGERLARVHERIERAASACGRDATSVRLVAVSKKAPVDAIRAAYVAGQRDFGESYAQELAAKAQEVGGLPGLCWHFVGHVQTNKAKLVARHAHVVHTVDSPALARELGKRAARERPSGDTPMPVLVEVNVAGEQQKAGISPVDFAEVAAAVRAEPALVLRGLMTVPPAGDPETTRRTFAALAALRDDQGGAEALPELSMGMTGDLEIAIACGATIVRVGTAIFGPRPL